MNFPSVIKKLRGGRSPVLATHEYEGNSLSSALTEKDILELAVKEMGGEGESPYIRQHAERFAQSISFLKSFGEHRRVLDVAGNVFSKLCLSEFLNPETIEETPKNFDIEIDDWSSLGFQTESFDLVVLTEVIEHLSARPAEVIFQANRLLRPGGFLFITTPNIGSSTSIYNLAHGHSPYHWGGLTGERGDRHQREYAISELDYLVAAQGFKTRLITTNVYEATDYKTQANAWLSENLPLLDKSKLGDTIFVMAKKVLEPPSAIATEPVYLSKSASRISSDKRAEIASRMGALES